MRIISYSLTLAADGHNTVDDDGATAHWEKKRSEQKVKSTLCSQTRALMLLVLVVSTYSTLRKKMLEFTCIVTDGEQL